MNCEGVKKEIILPTHADLLGKYEGFYQAVAIKKIVEAVKPITNQWSVKAPNTIDFGPLSQEKASKIGRALWDLRDKFFVARLVLQRKKTQDQNSVLPTAITIDVDLDYEEHYSTNLLKLAKEYSDPVQFLLDHQEYWSFRDKKICAYLCQPGHIEHPGVFERIEAVYENKHVDTIIPGLAEAQHYSHLYARAEQLLVKFGFYRELLPFIDRQDIREDLLKVSEDHPDYTKRLIAFTLLEGMGHIEDILEIEICKRMLLDFDFDNLTDKDAMKMEQIFWSMPQHACHAWEQCGGHALTKKLCAILAKSKSTHPPIVYGAWQGGLNPLGFATCKVSIDVPVYSILKYLGLKTFDQEQFNLIVNSLVNYSKSHDVGALEKISTTLYQFNRYNPTMKIPETEIAFPKPSLTWDKTPHSALGSHIDMDEEEEWNSIGYNHYLNEIINNPTLGEDLRIIALRKAASHLFDDSSKLIYSSNREQADFAKEAIIKFANVISTPPRLRKEAERLIQWAPEIVSKEEQIISNHYGAYLETRKKWEASNRRK